MTDPALTLPPLPDDLQRELAARSVPPRPLAATPVTEALRVRLTEHERHAVREAMPAELGRVWRRASGPDRSRVEIAAVVAVPVEDVEAREVLRGPMGAVDGPLTARSLLRATIDTGGADLTLAALEAAHVPLASGARILDIGEGGLARLRAFAAARPDLQLTLAAGDDELAVAREAMPETEAVRWDPGPAFDAGPVDLAVALELFAGLDAAAAVAAIGTLRGAVAVGGRLVLAVPGLHALSVALAESEITAQDAAVAIRRLYGSGYHAGARTFATVDWLTAHLTPRWAVLLHRVGAAPGGEDAVVLERRS